MNVSFYGPLFTFCRKLVHLISRPYKTVGTLPKNPVVYVGHHQNLFGPFIVYHSFPIDVRCWILHVFLEKEACYNHYRNYTFTKRFGWNKWMASFLAFVVSRFIPSLLQSGKGIPVYRGTRNIINTFHQSVESLKEGKSIAIFPTIDYQSSSNTLEAMYEGFLSVEKYYFRETGKHITFVPLYASKEKKTIFIGQPISFTGNSPFINERKVVLEKLQTAINDLANEKR